MENHRALNAQYNFKVVSRMLAQRAGSYDDDQLLELIELGRQPLVRATELTPNDRINLSRFTLTAIQGVDLEVPKLESLLEFAIKTLLDVSGHTLSASESDVLGQLLYHLGRYDESWKALNKSVELHGDLGPSIEGGPRWWYLATLHAQEGELDHARRLYDVLLTESTLLGKPLIPLVEELREWLGVDHPDAKSTNKQMLRTLLDANSTYWRPYFTVGEELSNEEEFVSARKAFASAARCLESTPEALRTANDWGYLAQTHYEAGNYESAKQALAHQQEKSRETHPTINNGPRWWYRAMLLARKGDKETARSYYEQLVKQMYSHAAPNRDYNERYREELARLLGIEDPTPSSPRSDTSGNAAERLPPQ